MYEVFINNKRLLFYSEKETRKLDTSCKKIATGIVAIGQSEQIIETIVSEEINQCYFILSEDPNKSWELFFKNFKHITAAGGLVINKKKEVLFIKRNYKWDLPKGKVEKNEVIRSAALREVKEETGIGKLKIIKSLPETYHIYKINNEFVLKDTRWFLMYNEGKDKLKPQEEEGITQVKWMNLSEIKTALSNSYASIEYLINYYLTMQ